MEVDAKFCPNCGEKNNAEKNYTAPKPFETNSVDESQNPQYQKSAFKGKQMSVGTSGNVSFGSKNKSGFIGKFFKRLLVLAVIIFVYIIFFWDNGAVYGVEITDTINFETYEAIDPTSEFGVNTSEIYVTYGTQNLEIGTVIVGVWYYEGEEITRSSLSTTLEEHQAYFSLSRPTAGWPVGDYEIQFEINHEVETYAVFSVVD